MEIEGFKIERKPIPEARNSGKYRRVLDGMKVGDCVLVPTERNASGLMAAARKNGVKVRSKKETDGVRVWKVSEQPASEDNGSSRSAKSVTVSVE